MTGIEISGGKELNAALAKLAKKIENDINDVVMEFGLLLTSNIKKGYHAHQSSGVTYYRERGDKYMTIRAGRDGPPVAFVKGGGAQNLSATHIASAPGYPPNSDTGRLANSVTFRVTGQAEAEVFSNAKYGPMLEFGTLKIKPRPLWRPEREKLAPKYVGKIKSVLEEATK